MARGTFPALLVLVVAACAATVPGQARAPAAAGEAQQVALEASSFKFVPNEVKVAAGQPVEVTVTNVSDGEHNITITGLRGERLAAADLPPRATVKVSFLPPEPGRYEFYYDKFGHATLGMSGGFVASPATGGSPEP